MARLIRTEKEVEGRYEDVWIVVDEDALDQWPEGPLTTVGREQPRIDGLDRARGQVQYTADVQLPGMLHTAVLVGLVLIGTAAWLAWNAKPPGIDDEEPSTAPERTALLRVCWRNVKWRYICR